MLNPFDSADGQDASKVGDQNSGKSIAPFISAVGKLVFSTSVVVGALSVVFSTAALLGSQAAISIPQLWATHNARDSIASARSEQVWLVGQALANKRPIGAFGASLPRRSAPYANAKVNMAVQLNGYELNEFSSFVAATLGLAFPERVISMDSDRLASSAGAEDGDRQSRANYRREEGLAQMAIQSPEIGALPGLPPAASTIVASALAGRLYQKSYFPPDWRSAWMASVYSQAFADAYSCLSIARHGSAAMKECALSWHMTRIFPTGDADRAVALSSPAEPLNVDMASFITGQLDADSVAKLDVKGITELSSKIAGASLSWAIARQQLNLGFFSENGRQWWDRAASHLGISHGDATLSWANWSSDAMSDKPAAVFGKYAWSVSGILFESQGLPAYLSSKTWRFEGLEGRLVKESTNAYGQAQLISVELNDFLGIDSFKGREAARLIHQLLAARLGADLDQQERRLAAQVGGNVPLEDFILVRRLRGMSSTDFPPHPPSNASRPPKPF